MQDYWNYPPEEAEVPECCDREMDVDKEGNCKCSTCGKVIKAAYDIEPLDPVSEKCSECGEGYPCKCCMQQDLPKKCPHDKEWGECAACDHAGDLAYDAARETAGRRR